MKLFTRRRRRLVSAGPSIAVFLGALVSAIEVHAFSSSFGRGAFSNVYPDSQSEVNAGCKICHAASNLQLNPYGKAICDTTAATLGERITSAAVENADSDGNGDNNIYEINASAQPGWTATAVPTYNTSDCSATGLTETVPVTVTGDLDPIPEICDNEVDDNANGAVDCADPQCDGFVDGACSTGLPSICAVGTLVCQKHGWVCVQNYPGVCRAYRRPL